MERLLLLLVENGHGPPQSGQLIQRRIAGWSHGVLHSSSGGRGGGLVVRGGSCGARLGVHERWVESGGRLLLLRDSVRRAHDAAVASGRRGGRRHWRRRSFAKSVHSAHRWIAVGWHSVPAAVAAVQIGKSAEAGQAGHARKSRHSVIVLMMRSVGRSEAKQSALVQVERRGRRRRRRGDWRGSAHAVGCRGGCRVDRRLDGGVLGGREPRERIETGGGCVVVRVHASHGIGHGERIGRRFVGHAGLGFATGTVFVVRVLFHVQSPKSFRLVDEWTLFIFI